MLDSIGLVDEIPDSINRKKSGIAFTIYALSHARMHRAVRLADRIRVWADLEPHDE